MAINWVRGTTPTIICNIPFLATDITTLFITFSQNERTVVEKTLSDVEIDIDKIKFTLSQEETLRFKAKEGIEVQIRCKIGEKALASKIKKTTIERILKDGVI